MRILFGILAIGYMYLLLTAEPGSVDSRYFAIQMNVCILLSIAADIRDTIKKAREKE